MAKNITTREQDFSQWYLDVIETADLAEHSPVKGSMVIKPNGYAIWENMQKDLDKMFKNIGVKNAYFPLFIPESFIKKEAEHIEGFSPELAVVTHAGGKKLDEPLVVRPTSETIIYDSFSRWIQSHRDLPMLINQWANIVRWELRPRLFLRTTEFLWQEGHTAHATADEARDYALMILNDVYTTFAQNILAIPVLSGEKSAIERFAGAKSTYCIEALMQDGKSLQAGTSHDLADNFAKSFDVKFQDTNKKNKYVFSSSWGVSTRLIGGLIMIHSDDKGLVLPPKIAPVQVVIVPILNEENKDVLNSARDLYSKLELNHSTILDDRENERPGEKFYHWEKTGVPIRIEIGPKDVATGKCVMVRRDTSEKQYVKLEDAVKVAAQMLEQMQKDMFARALKYREDNSYEVNDWDDFIKKIEQGGYVYAHWCEDSDCEMKIKEKTKATTRCLTFDAKEENGDNRCVLCGTRSPSNKRWVFAKAY